MRHGVTMLLVAMGLTPGVDGLAKVLTASASPFMVTFLRFLSAGLIALCLAHLMGLRVHVPRTRWLGQIGRTALLVMRLEGSLSRRLSPHWWAHLFLGRI